MKASYIGAIMATGSYKAEFALGKYGVTDEVTEACNAQSEGAFEVVYWALSRDSLYNINCVPRGLVAQ